MKITLKVLKWLVIILGGIILIILLLAGPFFVCDGKYEDIRETGEALNPVSYCYDVPIQQLREIIDSCKYTKVRMKDLDIDKRGKDTIGFFYGINLSNKLSYVYKNTNSEWLEKYTFYIMTLDSLTPNLTQIRTIESYNSIVAGYYWSWNPHTTDFKRIRYLEVPSNTIEEYEILRFIGKKAGQKGMPPIRYPKAITWEELQKRFLLIDGKQTLPFTRKEVCLGKN